MLLAESNTKKGNDGAGVNQALIEDLSALRPQRRHHDSKVHNEKTPTDQRSVIDTIGPGKIVLENV